MSRFDEATQIALDSSTNIYISGRISDNFATPGAFKQDCCGYFIAKLNATASQLIYLTYLEGDVYGLAVDASGNSFATGLIAGYSFTTTAGAFQRTSVDGAAAFVLKLNASGSGLLYSTLLGGTGYEVGQAIAVGADGSAYVTGWTGASDFPTTPGALQTTIVGGGAIDIDTFVTKVNPAGSALSYSTLIGGTDIDFGQSISVASDGSAFVSGIAGTGGAIKFPTTPGAYLPNTSDGGAAFGVKLNPTGTALIYSTFLGSRGTSLTRVAVNQSGEAYFTGNTFAGFPTTPNSFQTSTGGLEDAFIAKLNASGSALLYASYLGGSNGDDGRGLALDASGNAYIVGRTFSTSFPITPGATRSTYAGDLEAFFARIDNTNVTCAYSLNPLSSQLHAAGEGTGNVSVTASAGCVWVASSPVPWIAVGSGSSAIGSGMFEYFVGSNISTLPRTADLRIAGKMLTISQAAGACIFSISEPGAAVPASGITASFSLTPNGSNCRWASSSNANWAQVYPLTGAGTTAPEDVTYTVYPNYGTQQRIAIITAGGQTFTITQPPVSGTLNDRLVGQMYFSFLGRTASTSEIAAQVNAINSGLPRGELVMNFLNSQEFNLGGRFVAGLYVGVLNRDAEYSGWLFQRNAFATGMVNQVQLVSNFIGSAEYLARFGNPGNQEFVRLMYRYILLREASQPEVDFQTGVLAGGATRTQLASAFLNSAEFRTGTGPRLTAFLLHATLLQRGPSAGELASRSLQLGNGMPIRTLVDQFIGSAEFINLFQ